MECNEACLLRNVWLTGVSRHYLHTKMIDWLMGSYTVPRLQRFCSREWYPLPSERN